MKNALPVGENLKTRGINQTAACSHCNESETGLHLFFHCTFAKQDGIRHLSNILSKHLKFPACNWELNLLES
ncbi:putative reverse transcriptase zinc-binding domain-containing protein [Arabidopsis thaliana]